MSILIKGTKMPKDCFECPLYNLDHVCVILKRQNLAFDKPIDCPLVEIPPHGELIDRNKLLKSLEHEWNFSDDTEFANKIVWKITETAPTVIESEGEDERLD